MNLTRYLRMSFKPNQMLASLQLISNCSECSVVYPLTSSPRSNPRCLHPLNDTKKLQHFRFYSVAAIIDVMWLFYVSQADFFWLFIV